MHQLRIDPEVIIRVAADNFPRGKTVKVIENFCGDGRMDGQKGQGGRSIVDGIDACGGNGSEVGFCGQEEAVDVLAELEGEAEEVAAGLMMMMMMGLVGLMLIWGIWRSHYRYEVLDVVFTLDVYTPHVHVPGDRECGNLEGVESDVDILSGSIPDISCLLSNFTRNSPASRLSRLRYRYDVREHSTGWYLSRSLRYQISPRRQLQQRICT